MKLTHYLRRVLSNFNDSRVIKNATELVKKIIAHQTMRLWSISEDKKEFDRNKRLLDGSLKSVLDAEKTSTAILAHSVAALGAEARLIVLHDPCDIRKAYAEKLEKLGKVRDLDGNIINGYSTFNTVAVDQVGKQLYPVDIMVYSNGDEHYVTVAEMAQYDKGKLQQSADENERARSQQIARFIAEESYLNLPQLAQQQLQEVSQAFKKRNRKITLCHVLDRQFDGKNYFAFIDQQLHDEFVIRAKITRNSNTVQIDSQTGKTTPIKLAVVALEKKHRTVIDKLRIKKKLYQNASCVLEWGKILLDSQEYTVVRITLKDGKGKAIYPHPMLLITNIQVKNAAQARGVYGIYLMRAKIEAVFKFLKDVLGWEEFQVRDYESIKNIIALAYFIGGYFYEMGADLATNPTMALIAQLGGGKGKVTRHYFLQGLKQLLIYQQVERFVKEQQVEPKTFETMMDFVT